MRRILVVGAGKSSPVCIDYLLSQAAQRDWEIVVADAALEAAQSRVAGRPHGRAVALDVEDASLRRELVTQADVVVSLMPPHLHQNLAEDCVHFRRHFVTASYVPESMRALDGAAHRAGVTLLNEMGVDPGIDHMSAMEKLDALRAAELNIVSFETFTGGLVAPDCDNNPWGYKFTWNPRNVVLAGRDGGRFKHNGRFKYVPYHKLFSRYETVNVPGYGSFEGYPNRDSLSYRAHYDLWDVATLFRGTLRRPGFCKAWDCLVQLGVTDDSYEFEGLDGLTYRDFMNAYLWFDPDMSVELKLRAYLKMELNSPEFDKLKWLGLLDNEPIGLKRGTPAQILQKRLEDKWTLDPSDRDMVAMVHRVVYAEEGQWKRVQSSMVALGDDASRTAMAKTVGLPVAIAAELLATGGIARPGVVLPTTADIYGPVLHELRKLGISFSDETTVQSSPHVP